MLRQMAPIVRQSCSNNMFNHWEEPSKCKGKGKGMFLYSAVSGP